MQIYSGGSRKFMEGWGWGGFLVVWGLFWYSPPPLSSQAMIWSPQIHMYMYSYLLQAHRQEFPKEVLLRQKPWSPGISVLCKILQSSSFQALYSNFRKVSPVFQNWFFKISIISHSLNKTSTYIVIICFQVVEVVRTPSTPPPPPGYGYVLC